MCPSYCCVLCVCVGQVDRATTSLYFFYKSSTLTFSDGRGRMGRCWKSERPLNEPRTPLHLHPRYAPAIEFVLGVWDVCFGTFWPPPVTAFVADSAPSGRLPPTSEGEFVNYDARTNPAGRRCHRHDRSGRPRVRCDRHAAVCRLVVVQEEKENGGQPPRSHRVRLRRSAERRRRLPEAHHPRASSPLDRPDRALGLCRADWWSDRCMFALAGGLRSVRCVLP